MNREIELFESLTGLSTSITSLLQHIEHDNAEKLLSKFANPENISRLVHSLVERKMFGSVATSVGEMLIPTQDEVMSLFLRRFGVWESKESWIMSKLMPGAQVLNFGCALGWYLLIAQKANASVIVGIDANPIACEVAKFNCAVNVGVQPSILNFAISKNDLAFELVFEERNFGNTTVSPRLNGRIGGQRATFFIEKYNPDVIISDIQGYDWQILEAFYEYSNNHKIVMLENDPSVESTQALLLSDEYSNYELQNGILCKMKKGQLPSPDQSTIFVATGRYEMILNELLDLHGGLIPNFGNAEELLSEFYSGVRISQD